MASQAEIDLLHDHISMLEQRLISISPLLLKTSVQTFEAIAANMDEMSEQSPYIGMLHRFYIINRLQLKSIHDGKLNEVLFKAINKAQHGD